MLSNKTNNNDDASYKPRFISDAEWNNQMAFLRFLASLKNW